jgi:ABC-type transporter Mla subunit MlaD
MDWSIVLDVGVGIGVLLVGIGVLIACTSLAGTFKRLNVTLDVVDEQVQSLGRPIGQTLDHVGGIADTADQTLARLKGVVGSLETVAGTLGSTADLAKEAVAPAIVNAGAALAGVTAGLRRIFTGRTTND